MRSLRMMTSQLRPGDVVRVDDLPRPRKLVVARVDVMDADGRTRVRWASGVEGSYPADEMWEVTGDFPGRR